jgi:hypothetical protein
MSQRTQSPGTQEPRMRRSFKAFQTFILHTSLARSLDTDLAGYKAVADCRGFKSKTTVESLTETRAVTWSYYPSYPILEAALFIWNIGIS